MRLVKLKDGSYLNPERINLIEVKETFSDGYAVEISYGKKSHTINFSDFKQAEDYLEELVDLCQETSHILNRLEQLETDIRYFPGGPEYQKALSNFETLAQN